MRVTIVKKSARTRPAVCPWLIDVPTEVTSADAKK
jgi:hypothetical protein